MGSFFSKPNVINTSKNISATATTDQVTAITTQTNDNAPRFMPEPVAAPVPETHIEPMTTQATPSTSTAIGHRPFTRKSAHLNLGLNPEAALPGTVPSAELLPTPTAELPEAAAAPSTTAELHAAFGTREAHDQHPSQPSTIPADTPQEMLAAFGITGQASDIAVIDDQRGWLADLLAERQNNLDAYYTNGIRTVNGVPRRNSSIAHNK